MFSFYLSSVDSLGAQLASLPVDNSVDTVYKWAERVCESFEPSCAQPVDKNNSPTTNAGLTLGAQGLRRFQKTYPNTWQLWISPW